MICLSRRFSSSSCFILMASFKSIPSYLSPPPVVGLLRDVVFPANSPNGFSRLFFFAEDSQDFFYAIFFFIVFVRLANLTFFVDLFSGDRSTDNISTDFGELLVVTEIKKVIHKRYFSQKRAASLGKKGLVLLSRLPSEDIEYFAGGREIFIRIFQRNAMVRGLTLPHYRLS